jgi:TRAP-type C4-dicarboxylate transport system substrate-binding protein
MGLFRRSLLASAAALSVLAALPAQAQTVTLRLHQFLPPMAAIPVKAIIPWAKKVETESGGRIKIQMFHAMQMGGTPPQLFDQAKDGVADITWTVLGYTPGRFNRSEVFELPFMCSGGPEKCSRAFHQYVETNSGDEFKDVKLLAAHTHGPGLFHTKEPVTGLESLRGMKIRGGSRIINNMLVKLGATPVGMPVPGVTDALTKGVIDGATIPWEVTPSVKIAELVKNHTTFAGKEGLYTQTFGFVMNKASYDKLPPDLKKVIDNNSGIETAALFGRAMDEGDKIGRDIAIKAGNKIIELEPAEVQRWKRTAATVETDWINEMKGKGIDGTKLAAEARALVAKNAN